VAGAVVLVLLGGCAGSGGGAVSVSDRVAPAQQRACRALVATLPRTVDDQRRRTVTGSPYAAAWGDPAIVLRCGVGRPAGYTRTAGCETVDGIDWFIPAAEITDDHATVLITLLKRTPRVELQVPATYRPEGPGNAMVDLARVVRARTSVHGHCA
jgi:hypothetical protein